MPLSAEVRSVSLMPPVPPMLIVGLRAASAMCNCSVACSTFVPTTRRSGFFCKASATSALSCGSLKVASQLSCTAPGFGSPARHGVLRSVLPSASVRISSGLGGEFSAQPASIASAASGAALAQVRALRAEAHVSAASGSASRAWCRRA